MYGYNAFNDYGYGNSNQPPTPPVGNAGFGQLITQPVTPTTNYKDTQFTYSGDALAYTQPGVTAAPQQTASYMPVYGQQPQTTGLYSPGYSMYNAQSVPSPGHNLSAATGGGIQTNGSLSAVNSTAFGQNADYYSGYEQNLFATAVPSQWQVKNSGKTNNSMRGGKRGKGNFRGSSSRQGIGKRGREPQQQLFCDVCKVTCGGNLAYKLHLEGKAHKKKEAIIKGEKVQCLPRSKVSFKCDVCNVLCSAQDMYDAHVKGAQHQKRIATLKKMGQPLPPMEPTLIPPKNLPVKVPAPSIAEANKKIVGVSGTKFICGTELHTTNTEAFDNVLEQTLLVESKIALIGEEFIEELIGANGKVVVYNCKLCNCKLTGANERVNHLKGRRHKLQYKIKVNPAIEVDKPGTPKNPWKTQGKQQEYFYSPQAYLQHPTFNRTPIQTHPMFQQQPIGQCIETNDDRHVVAKNDAIQPTKAESNALQKLVALAERALKNISDKFAEEEKVAMSTASTESNTADANPERLLKGVMRVGLLAKNLFLRTDREVNLVVLCSKIPTESLLEKVCDLFPDSIEKEETELLHLAQSIPEACLLINFADSPVICRITFTSVLMREVASVCVTSSDEMTPGSAIQKPLDALPVQPCLSALDELKRTKFYQIKCASLHSMNIALRIVRDIRCRVKTWAPLSEWAVELLTEKALSSIQVFLGPGDAVRRVFEVVAGGVLLKGGSGLTDPCEKESTDVLADLHDQEREDITSSAQHALRLISFHQMYKVLAIDRLPDVEITETVNESGLFSGVTATGKRTRESAGFSSADNTLDVKKEKKEEPTCESLEV